MSSAAERLQHWLDQGYAFSQLNKGDPEELARMVKNRCAADQELMQAAKDRLASISPALLKRDHISRVYKEFLEKVLG